MTKLKITRTNVCFWNQFDTNAFSLHIYFLLEKIKTNCCVNFDVCLLFKAHSKCISFDFILLMCSMSIILLLSHIYYSFYFLPLPFSQPHSNSKPKESPSSKPTQVRAHNVIFLLLLMLLFVTYCCYYNEY